MEAWAGEGNKTITLHVKPGDEQYAGELIRFMYTKKVPYNSGATSLSQKLSLSFQIKI